MIAPLAGVSNIPFRLACLRYGNPLQYAEMVMAKSLFHKGSRSHDMLARAAAEKRLGAQLLGNDPEEMARAARMVEDHGFETLDLNFGCPVRKVVTRRTGAALLKEPEVVARIIAAVVKAVGIPVSAKIRTGWSPQENVAVEIARLGQDAGLSHITVHGRPWKTTRGGAVDFETIRRVREAVSIPVIGNGGIFSAADARHMLELTGVSGLMLARGVMGRPWLVREVEAVLGGRPAPEPVKAEEMVEAFRFHLDAICEYLPAPHRLSQLKQAATWYLRGIAHSKAIRVELYAARSCEDFLDRFRHRVGEAHLALAPGFVCGETAASIRMPGGF